ncbi:hypothetical protein RHMOL_Rhmol01G0348600 [Rhododendron molle]|uniref:Uncharacterized protein n=1 Tax=Rhododendron molle TaxID=49168 RepID=A0ACC0QA90_RHOML|nr:hypothetical protein RHMOL_Rhmol01G0348600 [Rhododendron molle]
MSTTATMSNQDRRFLNHALVGPSVKRKERDGFESFDDPKPKLARLGIPRPGSPAPAPEPASRNQLLAGYLAHEFLTKGTLFGQPWDPARAEAVPVSADSRRPKPSGQKFKAEMSSRAEPQVERNQRYVEVADLLKTDGAHFPGIVNPTQLARSLQL